MNIFKKLLLSYVTDVSRSKRLTIVISKIKSAILTAIQKNRYNREKILSILIAKQEISAIIILKVLKKNNFRLYKTFKKSTLTKIIIKARY